MKQLTILILCLASVVSQAQQSIPAIRGEINTYFPSTNNKSIQAIRLRETLNDVLDHVDTLNKKRFAKTIAETRLINNTNYEMVYIVDSGKEGWFNYASGSSAADDNTNTVVTTNGRRYVRAAVLATSVGDGSITNAKMANVPANTFKGNNTGSAAPVQDLTLSQVKTLIGVSNVDNTSDASKPVSIAQQTALNLKADIASPTFTGTPLAPTATAGTSTTQLATTAFVQAGLAPKQELVQYREDGSNVGTSGQITSLNVTGPASTLSNTGSSATLQIRHFETLVIALSAETGTINTATAAVTFRMPFPMFVQEVRASLVTAQTSGSLVTVDINENGTSIISTKLTFDNTERTTTTAATQPVISDTSLADDAEITIDVDQVGGTTAKGLKVTIKGYRL